jgi:hypothetical protein
MRTPLTYPEFGLSDESLGGSYQVGDNTAMWRPRRGTKIIDLRHREKDFEVAQESRGPLGRPRYFIKGFRQPDGKLLQGRQLTDLIQKLDYFWAGLITIPSQLNRIEHKVDLLLESRKRSSKTKLCLKPIAVTWPQRRYIPKGSFGLFARVPLPMIPASQSMAAGEYRLLMAILVCVQGSGLLAAGRKRLGKIANVHRAHVREYLESICNRAILRPTGNKTAAGAIEYELLTHPWLCDVDLLPSGEQNPAQGEQSPEENSARGGATVAPLKTSKTIPDKTINRPKATRLQEEDELLEQIAQISQKEKDEKGGIWRKRMRGPWPYKKAVRYAIEDWKLCTPDQRKKIRNPGAWLTDRFLRALKKIADAEAKQPPA